MATTTSTIGRSSPIDLPRPGRQVVELRSGATSGWHASLALELAVRSGRTALVRNEHEGPLRIQKPFAPGDGSTHVYILHPPAGLAGGDRLALDVQLRRGAHALLTTPASTKFYRSLASPSAQIQTLSAETGSIVEWLPAETILFGGSRAHIETRVNLEAGARFIGWEAIALGRPLSGDHYPTGTLTQRFELVVDRKPLLIERMGWDAGDEVLSEAWGLAGFGVWGSMYFFPCAGEALEVARRHCARVGDGHAAVTLVDDLLIIRVLVSGTEALRRIFEACWAALRQLTIGIEPQAPRIWTT